MLLTDDLRKPASEAAAALSGGLRVWDAERLDWMVDAITAATVLGFALPRGLSPLAAATARLIERARADTDPAKAFECLDSLGEAERNAVLEAADGFLPDRYAPPLADLLEQRGLLPQTTRLAAALVRDTDRVNRLVRRAVDRLGVDSGTVVSIAGEALIASRDSGVAAPSAAVAVWKELNAGPRYSGTLEAQLTIKLRLAARDDPLAAMEELMAAVGEVGPGELGEGLTAVVVRAVRRDRAQAREYLMRRFESLDARALIFHDLCYDGDWGAWEERAWRQLFEELNAPDAAERHHPVELWQAAMALLGAAAAARRGDLAAEVVRSGGLAPWAAYVATWPETRRQNLRDGRWRTASWDEMRPLLEARIRAPAVQAPLLAELPVEVLSALWQLKTMPLQELPWWSAWGVHLP